MIDNSVSMKWFRSFGVAIISIVLVCCACSEDDKLQQSGTDIAVLPIEDTDVDPLGDNWAVAFTSESSWNLKKSALEGTTSLSWVTFSTSRGDAGTTEVTINVMPNISGERRVLRVAFDRNDPNSETLDFRIIQEPAILETPGSMECGWLGEKKVMNVESNIRWELSLSHGDKDNTSWLGVNTGPYVKDMDIDIAFNDNNFSGTDHRAELTLVPRKLDRTGNEVALNRDVVDALTRKVYISQSNLVFLVDNEVDDPDLEPFSEFGPVVSSSGEPYVADPVSQDVTVASETDWNLIDKPDWIEVETIAEETQRWPSGVNVSIKDLRISAVQINNSKEQNDAILKLVSADDERAVREIKVVQNGYKLEATLISGDREIDVMAVDSTAMAELSIDTNGPWTIDETNIPDWLQLEGELTGVGEARIMVKSPVWNMEQEPKIGSIRISTGVNDIEEPVTANKAPFIFEIGENLIEGNKSVKDILKALPMKNTTQYDLKVDSSGPWDMTLEYGDPSDEGWFSVSESEGETGTLLKAGALGANPYTDKDRSLVITFVSRRHKAIGMDLSVPLTITQEKYVFNLDPYLFDNVPAYRKDGIQYTSELRCSYDWEYWWNGNVSVTSDPSGQNTFTDEQRNGLTYPTLYLNVGTNTLKEPVTKTVYIQSEYDNTIKEIQIHQEAFVFDVNTSQIPTGTLPYNTEGTYVVQVNSTKEVRWEVKDCPKWFNVNSSLNEGPKDDLEFTVKPNGGDERDCTIIIYNTVSGESPEITVKQAGYYFSVDKSSLGEFDELSGSPIQAGVTCTAGADGWKILSYPDWIKCEKGENKIDVSANQNLGEGRSGTIVLESLYKYVNNDRKQRRISVSQRGYVFNVTHDGGSGDITLPDYKSSEKTLSIMSSGDWTVSVPSDQSAVSASPSKGSASRSVAIKSTLTIAPNYDGATRSIPVTVQSFHFKSDAETPNLKKIINIIQPGYTFKVGHETSDYALDHSPAEFKDLSIPVSCSGEWEVKKTNETWLSVEKVDSGIKYSLESNTTMSDREAVIIVRTTDGSNKEIKITIKQSGK